MDANPKKKCYVFDKSLFEIIYSYYENGDYYFDVWFKHSSLVFSLELVMILESWPMIVVYDQTEVIN